MDEMPPGVITILLAGHINNNKHQIGNSDNMVENLPLNLLEIAAKILKQHNTAFKNQKENTEKNVLNINLRIILERQEGHG